MARKKSEDSKPADQPMRVEADVVKLARMVASFEDRSISDVVSEILRPVLKRRYEEHLKRAQQELAAESKPPKR